MDQDLIVRRVMEELTRKSAASSPDPEKGISMTAQSNCNLTEFVGTTVLDTIGMVIANVDPTIHEKLGLDAKYRSLGIISSRVGAGPQAVAADEAVKSTNTEVVMLELPRDTKGGGGHGVLIVFGAEEVSDARRAVEIVLGSLEAMSGDVYMNDAGHIEVEYSARASQVLSKYLGADEGKAWGFLAGCPAGIGVVMADVAVKSANVELKQYMSPSNGTSFSNEFMIMVTGDSGAVKQAVMAGREAGIKLLGTMGDTPASLSKPYIN